MRVVIVCCALVVGCGDQESAPQQDASLDAVADAPIDASWPPNQCSYPSDCSSGACCITQSPGGAAYTSCGTPGPPFCVQQTCEPGQPCANTAETCQLTKISPYSPDYWICR